MARIDIPYPQQPYSDAYKLAVRILKSIDGRGAKSGRNSLAARLHGPVTDDLRQLIESCAALPFSERFYEAASQVPFTALTNWQPELCAVARRLQAHEEEMRPMVE